MTVLCIENPAGPMARMRSLREREKMAKVSKVRLLLHCLLYGVKIEKLRPR